MTTRKFHKSVLPILEDKTCIETNMNEVEQRVRI